MIYRLCPLLSGGAQSAEVFFISQLLPLCSGIREGGDIPAGSAVYGGAHGVSCCLVKLRALRSFHPSILVSVLEGGYISARLCTVDLLHLSNFDFLVSFVRNMRGQ